MNTVERRYIRGDILKEPFISAEGTPRQKNPAQSRLTAYRAYPAVLLIGNPGSLDSLRMTVPLY